MGTIGEGTKQIILDTYEILEYIHGIYAKRINLSELFSKVGEYQEQGLNLVSIQFFSLSNTDSPSSGTYCNIVIHTLTDEDIPIPKADIFGLVKLIFDNCKDLTDFSIVYITNDLIQITFKVNKYL